MMESMNSDLLVEMYRKELLIRHFESQVRDLYSKGKIPGFLHVYIGEEAVAVGVCTNLRVDDYITSTHRGHGHCIAKGADVRLMMAELFGKRTGYCKAKGGSMHLAAFDKGMLGCFGIVGAGFPIAVGAALSAKMRKTSQVSVCFFGDGAVGQGTFHESLNLASIWKLPVIFVCENNQYAESTHISRNLAAKNVADFAPVYKMPGVTVNGNDVMEVYRAAGEAVQRARDGKGPSLLECQTYRWEGHYEGDPWELYRTKEEVEAWKQKDPIILFKSKLIDNGIITEKEAEEIEKSVKDEVSESIRFAEESPSPSPSEALEDIFAK